MIGTAGVAQFFLVQQLLGRFLTADERGPENDFAKTFPASVEGLGIKPGKLFTEDGIRLAIGLNGIVPASFIEGLIAPCECFIEINTNKVDLNLALIFILRLWEILNPSEDLIIALQCCVPFLLSEVLDRPCCLEARSGRPTGRS